MRAFAELYPALDATTKTNAKVEALRRYFAAAEPADAAWAVYFLIGRRPRQVVPTRRLRAWAAEEAGIPEWLFGERRARSAAARRGRTARRRRPAGRRTRRGR